MGTRLKLRPDESLELQFWCDDPVADGSWTRLELWTNAETLHEAWETRGFNQLSRRVVIPPHGGGEQWYVVRVLRHGEPIAYSSPIWARWE